MAGAPPLAHPLDRPVWSALTSRQAHLARGDGGRALRLDPEYGPFAALSDPARPDAAALAALIPPGESVWMVEAGPLGVLPGITVVKQAAVSQMIAMALAPAEPPAFEVVALDEDDASEMRALAHLTEPGPFLPRTHRLGHFIGVKRDGRLVAMAGERMRPAGFTEVSGVCTHPDHRGQGYAAGLMRIVAARILARGESPFLHAYASNTGAIGLYEWLGFRERATLTLTTATLA